jgi:hypothetical protein
VVVSVRRPRGIRGVSLTSEEQAVLSRLVRVNGEQMVEQSAGVSPGALRQALGGQKLKKRSHELLQTFLERWSRENEYGGA